MQDALRVLFTGDLSITGIYRDQVQRGGEIFDKDVLDLFARYDFTVVNLEGPTTDAKNLHRPDINVVSPPETIPYLAARGINVFNCANNHIFDCDRAGLADTVDAIEAVKGQYFGAGDNLAEAARPVYLTGGGVTVALIGICNHRDRVATETEFGTFYDAHVEQVAEVIRKARKQADYLVLNYHAGEEYTTVPMPSRRRKMLQYADLGADVIVGHHSHVFQGHERRGACDIFYSLGNFVFDVAILRAMQYADQSALVSLAFTKSGVQFSLFPTRLDWERGVVATGSPDFLDHIQRISDFANYQDLWRRDAYRTIFQSRVQRNTQSGHEENQHVARPKNKRRPFLRPGWYAYQLSRFRNAYQRPIMIAACHEAVRRWFRH
jgi:poly-gamma-glutamate synthesis protein (capsule biosynthesis protein)